MIQFFSNERENVKWQLQKTKFCFPVLLPHLSLFGGMEVKKIIINVIVILQISVYFIEMSKNSKNDLFIVNPTLYGGVLVLVSGAFQIDLRNPKCWHNSYMILRISFMKKNFFLIFLVFGHPSHIKRFFCTFWPKIIYFYILGGQHVHMTHQKCFLEACTTKCPWSAPPVSTLTSQSPYKVGLNI